MLNQLKNYFMNPSFLRMLFSSSFETLFVLFLSKIRTKMIVFSSIVATNSYTIILVPPLLPLFLDFMETLIFLRLALKSIPTLGLFSNSNVFKRIF